MRNPKFKAIKPNYRKNALEVTLQEGRKIQQYILPFAVFRGKNIGLKNRIVSVAIEPELGQQGATLVLEDGIEFDFPSDFVLYYCDPTYNWSPINQLKQALRDKVSSSKLSVRVLADALSTSPSQVVRLLEENTGSKQMIQLMQIAELTGYQIDIQLKKKTA